MKQEIETDDVAIRTCAVTNKACSSDNSCSHVCSVSEKECESNTNCDGGEDKCTPQECKKEIVACSLFTRTENVRRYCDVTDEESPMCIASMANTSFKDGVTIVRQTAGNPKDKSNPNLWNKDGKCGLGFATKNDASVAWCDNDELRMQNITPDTQTKLDLSNDFFSSKDSRCEGTWVSQLCQRTMPPTFEAVPFDFYTIQTTLPVCHTPATEEDCMLYANIHDLDYQSNDGGTACKVSVPEDFSQNALSVKWE